MSQNSVPNTLPALEKFIRRTASAEKSQQKEIRFTIQEAREVVQELAMLTAQMNHNLQEIKDSIKKMADNTQNIDVKFDGGGF